MKDISAGHAWVWTNEMKAHCGFVLSCSAPLGGTCTLNADVIRAARRDAIVRLVNMVARA